MRAQLSWLCLLGPGLGALAPGTARGEYHAGKTMDPAFAADAGRSRLDVDPVVGERFEQAVNELFGLNATVVTKLRELLR